MIDKEFRRIIFILFFLSLIWLSVAFSLNDLQTKSEGDVKVMTWNIHGGTGTDNEEDIERTIREIKKNKPDILALQEVSNEKMILKIADELDMNFFFGQDYEDNEGNALLSDYPITEAENIYLNQSKRI